jgi:hypothetical protein
VACIVSSIVISKVNSGLYVFNSDLKVSSLYNIKKLQFKVDKNPTWHGSWMLLDALFPAEKGLLACLEECYAWC